MPDYAAYAAAASVLVEQEQFGDDAQIFQGGATNVNLVATTTTTTTT